MAELAGKRIRLRRIAHKIRLRDGQWVNINEEEIVPFVPLPAPFEAAVALDSLADVTTVSDDLITTVKKNILAGKKEGTVYGMWDRTQYGDTRGNVPYDKLVLE